MPEESSDTNFEFRPWFKSLLSSGGRKIERIFEYLGPFILPSALAGLVVVAFMVDDWSTFMHEEGHYVVLGAVLIGVWLEIWRGRIEGKAHQQIVDQRNRRELELLEQRLALEAQSYDQQSAYLRNEYRSIRALSERLALSISDALIEDPTWAETALQKATPYLGTRSLFSARSEHFREEKKCLADLFLPLLFARLEHHKDKDTIILIVDSGTTIHPLIEQLGRSCAKYGDNDPAWLSKLQVWTNNLPATMTLMDVARGDSSNPYSELVFQVHLLPGAPVPAFAAVAGELTHTALEDAKERAGGDSVVISLVTGNWIRIRETTPRCPVPLARPAAHLKIKQSFLDLSDEVFVVAPLGKIFADRDSRRQQNISEAVNHDLHLNEGGESDGYKEVQIDQASGRKVKLVSTTRRSDRSLYQHSNLISDRVEAREVRDDDVMNGSELLSLFLGAHFGDRERFDRPS